MSAYQRVKIIINPAAGKSEPVLSVLNDVFGPAEIEWDVALTHEAGDGVIAARDAVREGYDLVGVYGGDGTVAEVASALVEGGPPLLLLPGGTGNALADDLGIPPDLADAAALALGEASQVRRIDLGRAGERYFVLRMTMGIEVAMVGSVTREMKDRFGWLAYIMSAFSAISAPPTARYAITVDGEVFQTEAVAVIVANSASIGRPLGVRLIEEVSVSDGVLDVIVVEPAAMPSLLGSAAEAAAGKEPSGVQRWTGTRIRVEAAPPQAVLADGEDAGTTPIEVTVLPAAVGVLVPTSTNSDEAE